MFNNYQPQVPGQPQFIAHPSARNTQPLTQEQIQKLRQDANAFDLRINEEDLWKAVCTHKEKNGTSTLLQNPDGSWTCTICHETFFMHDYSQKEVEEAVDTVYNLLQTAKTLYVDAPDGVIAQFFKFLPVFKKFPQVWRRAMDNFQKYDGYLDGVASANGGYGSAMNTFNTLMSNPYGGWGMAGFPTPQPGYAPPQQPYAAPQYAYPPQQPMQPNYQQPYPAPAGAPVPAGMNPMAYGAPPAQYAPQPQQAPAPGNIPAPQPAPAQPDPNAAAPAQQSEVQQNQVFNV